VVDFPKSARVALPKRGIGIDADMIAEPWNGVSRELNLWADLGLRAKFWLRDDDACEMTAPLGRLHDLGHRHNINIGLAVIPGKIQPSLLKVLAESRNVFHPMCHGWTHADYGRPGKPEEFGSRRPFSAVWTDAKQAYRTFAEYFGGSNATFVPPYNRITAALINALPQIGFAGVSAWPGFRERFILRMDSRVPWTPAVTIPREFLIPRVDVHIDVMDWKRGTARETLSVAADIVGQLRLRRRGFLPSDYPIGLLTHHLVHDERVWELCHDLLLLLGTHNTVDFLEAASLFASDSAPIVGEQPLRHSAHS
jgi:peptidoglycan/xylan/chitin deacetylase (PgdA/CDA1 family)